MTVEECYARMGGNYAEMLSRMGNEDRVKRFILKFPAEPSMQTLRQAVADGRAEEAFRAAHSLKGVCANLGLNELQEAASLLTEELRGRQVTPAVQARLQDTEEKYRLAIDSIRLLAACE